MPGSRISIRALVPIAVSGPLLAWTLVTGGLSGSPAPEARQNLYQVPYNGDFTFTRIRYGSGSRISGGGFGSSSSWSHDYPAADRNLPLILDDFTRAEPNTGGSNVFDLEDEQIFLHPILYISEPGYWRVTREGAENLRNHLLKGGFLIFDDFEEDQWYNMADQMRLVLPDHEWFEIDGSHRIFGSFFLIQDIYVPHPLVRVTPDYQAMFEDNDPTKRIMVLANHNSDLAEYWEFPREFGLDPTNDAFRLGVNYLIYAMMH